VIAENPTSLQDRQRAARIEHDQWLKDHPDFSSKEMLDAWKAIRVKWGLTAFDKKS
jgi:hypothetical protein